MAFEAMNIEKIIAPQANPIKRMLEMLSDSERAVFWQRAKSLELNRAAERETALLEAVQRIISERIIKGKCDICERVDGCLLTRGQRSLCEGPFKW
jgi:hypothetical protein